VTKIHPTAIIAPDAEIDGSVEIGPGVCIEGHAVIGEGCVIQAHAVLSGSVRLGKNNLIGYGAIIGAWPQDLSFKPDRQSGVIVGDHNTIREYCTIHRASQEGGATRVGDHNFIMAGVHLAHEVELGNHNVLANNVLLGGHVRVADRVFLGGGSVYHQFIRIGRLAIVQGLGGFGKDIPPFTLAAEINTVAGLNVIGLRRAGFTAAQRQEIKDAFKLLYKSNLNVTQALSAARERTWGEHAREFWDFVAAAKKRGICDLLETAVIPTSRSAD
jgi:UDP-N-acetylglucosamine acyltransferase